MVLPTHSMGYHIMSAPFAFLSLQLLKRRPKRHQQAGPPCSRQGFASSPNLRSFPAELLHLIFRFAVDPSSADIDLVEERTLRATVFAISQICQHWRLAARDCPEIWVHATDFQRHTPEVIADFLQLSRPHVINVGHPSSPFRVAETRDLAILPLLKQERRRIREWNVEIFPGSHQPRIVPAGSAIFPLDQPSLRAIRATGECPSLVWNIHKLSSLLHTLSLRDLRVVFPLLPSLSYTRLTELTLAEVQMDIRPVESEWLALLQGMPRLQLLALRNTVRLDPLWQPLVETELPHLRLVSLRDADWHGIRAMRRLLTRLVLPANCGVDLNLPSTSRFIGSQNHLNEITTSIWRTMRRHLGGPALADLGSVDVPQVEFGMYATESGRYWATIGTVRHPDTTLDWNGQPGTSGVIRYLDTHASAHPRFAPLNISFEHPSNADFDLMLLLAEPLLPKATRLRVYTDRTYPSHSRNKSSRVVSSFMSRMPQLGCVVLE